MLIVFYAFFMAFVMLAATGFVIFTELSGNDTISDRGFGRQAL